MQEKAVVNYSCICTKKATWIEKYKIIDNVVLDDGPLSSDGTQQATEEKLSLFQSTNVIYDLGRLNPSGHLVVFLYRGEIM